MDGFQTTGAVLAFLLLVFQLVDRVPLLRRLFLDSIRSLKEMWKMFRKWRWWKQYCPSCEIVKVGNLEITKSNNDYHMELPIDVKYISRDNRHDTKMDTTAVYLDVISTGQGRDSKPYRLSRSNFSLKIHPCEEDEANRGGYTVMSPIWTLPCKSNVIIRYTFSGQIDAIPLVNVSTFCKIMAIGKAEVEGVTGSKQLKAPDKFSVKVAWQK